MKQIRFKQLAIILFTGLAIFFSISLGHAELFNSSDTHSSGKAGSALECQTFCPLLIQETQKASFLENDEGEPYPEPLILQIALSLNLMYMVALASLLLLYLQRKPPDLVLQYSNRRN